MGLLFSCLQNRNNNISFFDKLVIGCLKPVLKPIIIFIGIVNHITSVLSLKNQINLPMRDQRGNKKT